MQISLNVTGIKEVNERLNKLGTKFLMFDMAMRDIGQELSTYFANDAFLSQGGVFGEVWPRLRPETIAEKSKHYAGRPPEVRSGDMISGFRYTADRNSVRIFNNVDYFKYQQEGTSRLPARKMIGLNNVAGLLIKAIIDKDIQNKLARL